MGFTHHQVGLHHHRGAAHHCLRPAVVWHAVCGAHHQSIGSGSQLLRGSKGSEKSESDTFFQIQYPPKRDRTDLFNFIYISICLFQYDFALLSFSGVLSYCKTVWHAWSHGPRRGIALEIVLNVPQLGTLCRIHQLLRQHHSSAEIMDIPVYIYIII